MTHTPDPGGDQTSLVTIYTYEPRFNQIKTIPIRAAMIRRLSLLTAARTRGQIHNYLHVRLRDRRTLKR